jgi:hypothetical protein
VRGDPDRRLVGGGDAGRHTGSRASAASGASYTEGRAEGIGGEWKKKVQRDRGRAESQKQKVGLGCASERRDRSADYERIPQINCLPCPSRRGGGGGNRRRKKRRSCPSGGPSVSSSHGGSRRSRHGRPQGRLLSTTR